jgi:signal transduction histidine kinase/DNA-binding response OmpR family regulator
VLSVVTFLRTLSRSILRGREASAAASVIGFRTFSRRQRSSVVSFEPTDQLTDLVREHDRKTALLYTASHEVRGSMHGILGLVERLREAGHGSTNPALLDALGDACSGLRATVQQVLDVAQLEDTAEGLDSRAFDLRAVLREVTAVVSGVASNDVSVRAALDDACEPLRCGNAGRVNQILTNVAINGVRAMERGSLTIEVRSIGPDIVRFVVRDQGDGMPVFAQDRLTGASGSLRRRATDNPNTYGSSADPVASPVLSVRGGPDPSTLRRGSGLGLLIARELVEMLNGRVEVSVQWGAGTVVLIDLPLPPMAAGMVSAPEPEIDASISRTLIVDDAPDGLDFLSKAISQISETVDATVDSAEALDLAFGNRYDLVIVDGMMSPHDGADLTRAMRRLPTTHDSVIIVATGNVETVSASRYLAAGADLVLVKPFSRLELLRAVRRATAQRARAHDLEIDLRKPDVAKVTAAPDVSWAQESVSATALSIFASLLDGRIAAIAEAYHGGDAIGFSHAAHALGSPAVMLGLDSLGRCCLALDTVSRALGLNAIGTGAIDELNRLAEAHRHDLVPSLNL